MARKGTERALSSDGISTSKYNRWREAVKKLLVERWQPSLRDPGNLAATVVGMFDAGATDSEVAAFIRSQEVPADGLRVLSDEALLALAHDIHRAARFD
jgi:hypothetical protein